MPATVTPRPRSEAQRAASRANGARSRGPRTAEGKARSARNAFRHGLCSPAILAPGEDPVAFERLLAGLRAEYRPASPSEALLVERLAIAFWKLARCDRLEARLATIEPHCPPGRLWPDPGLPRLLSRVPELATLLRHQAQLGREVHRLTRLLATRPADAAEAYDPGPEHPAASDTDPPSAVAVVGSRADHPDPDPAVAAGRRPGRPASPDRPVPRMAGSPAGHDAGEDPAALASPVVAGPRPDHPVARSSVTAGHRPGHPASSPSSSSSPAPHGIFRNEPEPTLSIAARPEITPVSAAASTDRDAGPPAAGRTQRAECGGLPPSARSMFLARDHRPERECA